MSSRPYLDAVIGLGSNLGDRHEHLCAAVAALSQLGRLVAVSSVYESVAVGGPPQPPYLNAAARLATQLGPSRLLESLLAVESSRGRVRGERWGPRTLDLDLLWVRGLLLVDSVLTVPHPRLAERAFAMIPLVEVAPDATDPADGLAYVERLALVDQSGIVRVGPIRPCDLRGFAQASGAPTSIMTGKAR